MLQAVKRQFQMQRKEWLWGFAMTLVGSLFGMVLCFVIVRLSGATETYSHLGTMTGGGMAVIYGAVMTLVQIGLQFNLQVSMGSTRSAFFGSFYALNVGMNLLNVLLLILCCMAERAIGAVVYVGLENEIDMLPLLLKAGIPMALAIPAVGGLGAMLVMRFGRVAFWILWSLWMFGFLGVPKITDAMHDAPQSFFGSMGSQLAARIALVPEAAWIALAVAGSLLCIGVTWLLIRKQQVTA